MKRIFTLAFLSLLLNNGLKSQVVIANHTVVDKYDDIPQQWIDSVKTMMAIVVGASHAEAYHEGCDTLEQFDSKFAYQKGGLAPLPDTDEYFRMDRWIWGNYSNASGWQGWNYNNSWWTTELGKTRLRGALDHFHASSDTTCDAIWFGWSYDATWQQGPGGDISDVYHTRWAGGTYNGPDGNIRWGLTQDDSVLTDNRLDMDDYLNVTKEYIEYCEDNSMKTEVVYTTGAVDNDNGQDWPLGESGYQQYLKWEYIRDYVNTLDSGYFIDYADILSYNDAGEQQTTSWTDYNGTLQTFPIIHPENTEGSQDAHIGAVGMLKIGKATWWLMARMSGWDGSTGSDNIPPTVPEGLTLIMSSEDSVSISWNASTDNVGVLGYRIYRGGIYIGTTNELTYTDNTVTACSNNVYSVSAYDAAGNESAQSQGLEVNNCPTDITPTLIVTPNIMHGITNFDLIVRITELNLINTSGIITVNIPKESRWSLPDGFVSSLTVLGTTELNNSEWVYDSDATNHIFSSSTVIPAGGSSTFGFRVTFDPGDATGVYTITSQIESGGGGELKVSNNADSEKIDYFQE